MTAVAAVTGLAALSPHPALAQDETKRIRLDSISASKRFEIKDSLHWLAFQEHYLSTCDRPVSVEQRLLSSAASCLPMIEPALLQTLKGWFRASRGVHDAANKNFNRSLCDPKVVAEYKQAVIDAASQVASGCSTARSMGIGVVKAFLH